MKILQIAEDLLIADFSEPRDTSCKRNPRSPFFKTYLPESPREAAEKQLIKFCPWYHLHLMPKPI